MAGRRDAQGLGLWSGFQRSPRALVPTAHARSCGGTPSGLLIREDESLVSPLQLGLADDSRWPLAAGHLDSDLDQGIIHRDHPRPRAFVYLLQLRYAAAIARAAAAIAQVWHTIDIVCHGLAINVRKNLHLFQNGLGNQRSADFLDWSISAKGFQPKVLL